jgi:hypothetical protein
MRAAPRAKARHIAIGIAIVEGIVVAFQVSARQYYRAAGRRLLRPRRERPGWKTPPPRRQKRNDSPRLM